jgi:hypothetical protein
MAVCCKCGLKYDGYLCEQCFDKCSFCGDWKSFHSQMCKSCWWATPQEITHHDKQQMGVVYIDDEIKEGPRKEPETKIVAKKKKKFVV